MNAPVLQAVQFDVPLVNPSPQGLFSAVSWTEDVTPRWLDGGVQFRPYNYGGWDSVGVWHQPWCGTPGSGSGADETKTGVRPLLPDPFAAVTVWGFDECDLTVYSQKEIRIRATQNLRLLEQTMVERMFADRLLADATDVLLSEDNLRAALGYLEGRLAMTNTVGVIHASPEWASREFGLVVSQGTTLRTPLGNLWVFGGGYVDGLGDTIVATSPLYGWRTAPTVIESLTEEQNTFAVIAERSVVVGYEYLIGAVNIVDGS